MKGLRNFSKCHPPASTCPVAGVPLEELLYKCEQVIHCLLCGVGEERGILYIAVPCPHRTVHKQDIGLVHLKIIHSQDATSMSQKVRNSKFPCVISAVPVYLQHLQPITEFNIKSLTSQHNCFGFISCSFVKHTNVYFFKHSKQWYLHTLTKQNIKLNCGKASLFYIEYQFL